MSGGMSGGGFWGSGIRLVGLNDQNLQQLAMETGVSFQLLKAQQRAEMASAGSTGMMDENNETLVPTVEIRLKTNPGNPRKARKKNIKMLRKALRPPAYNLGLFKIYRYNAHFECACCGVDCRRFLPESGDDNAYSHIKDETTGLSLSDMYWFDPESGEARKPHARTRGDHGDELNSTLCPAHLHIYHTLNTLVQEQELESEGVTRPTSIGTRFLRVPGFSRPKQQNRSTPDSLLKYEPFFREIQKDANYQKGITLTQHPNPISGVADLVTVTFDLRALQIQSAMQQNGAIGIRAPQPQQQQTVVSPTPPVQVGATE
jgi:hypothetical protein